MLIISTIYVYLKINPFRNKNFGWNSQNNRGFYGFLLDISRAFVFTLDSPNSIMALISLVMEIFKNQVESGKVNSLIVSI